MLAVDKFRTQNQRVEAIWGFLTAIWLERPSWSSSPSRSLSLVRIVSALARLDLRSSEKKWDTITYLLSLHDHVKTEALGRRPMGWSAPKMIFLEWEKKKRKEKDKLKTKSYRRWHRAAASKFLFSIGSMDKRHHLILLFNSHSGQFIATLLPSRRVWFHMLLVAFIGALHSLASMLQGLLVGKVILYSRGNTPPSWKSVGPY